jgi:hypothetical protein
MEETGLGALGSPVSPDDEDGQSVGLLDYSLASITHVTPTSATVVFTHPSGSLPDMSLAIPATGSQLHCASPTCRQATAATLAPATLLHPRCLTCHIARHDHDNYVKFTSV